MVPYGEKTTVKVAFRLDADNATGMGHAVRCSALAAAFMELGCECTYLCRVNAEIKEFTAFNGLGFKPVPRRNLDGELNWAKNALAGYDAVIIDSYFISDTYIEAINRPGLTVVCVDDNALYEYSCDAVVNGNLHAKELSYRTGRKKPKMLLGGSYTLLRSEFRETEPIEIQENANRIFVCFGGSDIHNFTPKAISALQAIPGVSVTVALGAMTVCDAEVRAAAGDNAFIIKDPASMAEVMRSCDIAVTACGSMIYELASLGIPSIVTVHADNQRLIADYLAGNGLMRNAGDAWSICGESLRAETQSLLRDVKRRKRESAALIETVSRHGAENTAGELLKIIAGRGENVHT